MTTGEIVPTIPDFGELYVAHRDAVQGVERTNGAARDAKAAADTAEIIAERARAKPTQLVRDYLALLATAPELYQASFFLDRDYSPKMSIDRVELLHKRGAFLCELTTLLDEGSQPALVFKADRRGDSKHPILAVDSVVGQTADNGALITVTDNKLDVETGSNVSRLIGLDLVLTDITAVVSKTPGFDDATWIEEPSVQSKERYARRVLERDSIWMSDMGFLVCNALGRDVAPGQVQLGNTTPTRDNTKFAWTSVYIGEGAIQSATADISEYWRHVQEDLEQDTDTRGLRAVLDAVDEVLA